MTFDDFDALCRHYRLDYRIEHTFRHGYTVKVERASVTHGDSEAFSCTVEALNFSDAFVKARDHILLRFIKWGV